MHIVRKENGPYNYEVFIKMLMNLKNFILFIRLSGENITVTQSIGKQSFVITVGTTFELLFCKGKWIRG